MNDYFESFLRALKPEDIKAECLLPVMVNDLLKQKALKVKAISSPDGEICTSRSHKGVAAEPEAAKLKAIQVNKCFISGSIFFSLDSCEDR